MSYGKVCLRCKNRVAPHMEKCRQCGGSSFRDVENEVTSSSPQVQNRPLSQPPTPTQSTIQEPGLSDAVRYTNVVGEVQAYYLKAIANFLAAGVVWIIGGSVTNWLLTNILDSENPNSFFLFITGLFACGLLGVSGRYVAFGFEALKFSNNSLD